VTAPRASILIPAYNEASVIAQTLEALTRTMRAGEFEIIVIANGCEDDTAAVARRAAPGALVLETATAGKPHALRMGLEAATGRALVFLDGDLAVETDHVRRLVAALERDGILASHGRMDVDLDGCSRAVRAFYAVWTRTGYLANGKFGGLFAVSRAGLGRITPFPDVTADDEFVSRQFGPDETAYLPDVVFTARAPRRLGDLFKTRKRSRRGTRELATQGHVPARVPAGAGRHRPLTELARQPRFWPALALYLGMSLAVRLALRLERPGKARWERDTSRRVAATNQGAA